MTTFPPAPVTCDAVRSKCREMLMAALQAGRECPPGLPARRGLRSEALGLASPPAHCC